MLGAGLVQHRQDLVEGLRLAGGNDDALALIRTIPEGPLNRGGSLIAAPDARILAQAGEGEETLHAALDLAEIAESLASLDVDGHYSRPDVFSLSVDRREQQGVSWIDPA